MLATATPANPESLLNEADIDDYLNAFYTDRLHTADFDPENFKLSRSQLDSLLDWIRAYDPSHQTPYDLYHHVIEQKLTAGEEFICFEEIYIVTGQGDASSEITDPDVVDDEQ